MDDDNVARQIVAAIIKARKTPEKRRQLLNKVVSLYNKVEKTEPKLRLGMMYLGLRAIGDTHEEACEHIAKVHKASRSKVEHCVAPTRRALSQRASLEKQRLSVAKFFNTLANAGKRRASRSTN
jgi:hypothetical protein